VMSARGHTRSPQQGGARDATVLACPIRFPAEVKAGQRSLLLALLTHPWVGSWTADEEHAVPA